MSKHTYLQPEKLGTVLKDGKHVNAPYECQNLGSKIAELEAALHEVIATSPEGDTDYKYGYAWERCITIASSALGPEQEQGDESL